MIRILRPSLLIALFAAALISCKSARAQVTSIYLSHMAGGPIASWTEETREISFDVVTPSHSEVLTLDYRVYAGTAEAGVDFVGSSGTFTFQPNEQIKQLTVQLLDDKLFEGNETFYIELTNAAPAYPISRPVTTITIRDDESGYAPESSVSAKENAGFLEVAIYRRGDIDFASSVEAYLDPGTAVAGVNYVDETFSVAFGPSETMKKIRVRLINNAIEDGTRYFRVNLRNPTDGVPISFPSAEMAIEDNELGYAWRLAPSATDLFLYEGGPERLILERRGDYDVRSVATVTATPLTDVPSPWLYPPADTGVDFIGSEFQVEFAPGQTSAEVPLVVVNDANAESREWVRLRYSTNLTSAGLGDQLLSIRDNELNPLPVSAICHGVSDPLVTAVTPLRDGKFLVGTADDFNNSYHIYRYDESGSLDPTFTPISLDGTVTKMVEGIDGKYTVGINRWRIDQQRLERYLPDGRPDEQFRPAITGHIYDFAVTVSGKVYVTEPLRRLNNDGSVDSSFAPADPSGERIILDKNENVYVRPMFRDWTRLTPAGSIDPTFSRSSNDYLFDIDGVLYRSGGDGVHRLTSTGADDPAFTTITNSFPVEGAPDGKLYGFRSVGAELFLDRYDANGVPDPAYMRATLDITSEDFWPWHAMRKDRRSVLFFHSQSVGSVNGVSMWCGNGNAAIADIYLDVPPSRILVEPGREVFREGDGAEGNALRFIRTGDNSAAKTIRYRVRPGTAAAGVHYSTAAEGEVVFGPGISRALIPIMIIDNTTPEMDRNFFIEMLGEDGAVLSTTERTIQNDDVGVQIVRREGTILYVLPIGGGLPYVSLMRSSDLVNWEYFATPFEGMPIPVDASDGVGFFQAYAYSN